MENNLQNHTAIEQSVWNTQIKGISAIPILKIPATLGLFPQNQDSSVWL